MELTVGYALTYSGFNMPGCYASNRGSKDSKKLKVVRFMEERTDLLNLLDGTIRPLQWIKDVISTNAFLWWNWRDPLPMIRVPNCIKKHFR